jgi:hypothetical protein
VLEQRLPTAAIGLRCAIVHALGILSDERSNLASMRAYDESTPEERASTCDPVRVFMRPDREADAEDVLMPAESFQMKALSSMGQMRATTPEIRAKVEPWLVELASSGPPELLDPARSVLEGIRAARDDSKLAPASDR